MKKLLIKISIIMLLLNGFISCAQNGKMKIKYSIIKDSYYPNEKDTITYYYILNPNLEIKIGDEKLSQFTFDQDSLATSGYISLKGKKINFSYDKKHLQKINLNGKTYNIKYFAGFGSNINIIPVNNKTYRIIQRDIIPSHKLYVHKIVYSKNFLFPSKIIFREMGSNKEFIAEGKPDLADL